MKQREVTIQISEEFAKEIEKILMRFIKTNVSEINRNPFEFPIEQGKAIVNARCFLELIEEELENLENTEDGKEVI